MKIKSLFAVALAATTLFSCSKEGENVTIPSEEGFTVGLRLVQDTPSTYAEGIKVDGSTTVALSAGVLYFADATTITKVTTITTSPTDATGGTNVNITDLGAGTPVNIADVPNSSTHIYLICNLGAVTPAFVAGSSVADLKALAIQVEALGDGAGAVTNVPLYGEGMITPPVPPLTTGTATVNLGAIASRVEIARMTAAATIDSYELEGIFINNYYASQGIGGSLLPVASPLPPQNNGGTGSIYSAGSSAYPASLQPIYDSYSPAIADVSLAVVPQTPSTVWAYNVFPAINAAPTDDNLPHIIVVLDNVSVGGTPVTGKRYLTLDAYKDGSSTPLDRFEKAKVYTIADIRFDETDLSVTPETKPMDVDVTVTPIQWSVMPITWDN